jgi:TldD protein
MPEYQWMEAVTAAARSLPADEPAGLVFVEEREDLRVALDGSAAPRSTWTGHRGSSVRRGADATRAWHRSDPEPSRLPELARGLLPAASSASPGGPHRLVPDRELADLRPWVEAVSEADEYDTHIGVSARIACFDQTIWVARAGGEAASDRRRGRRIRITATASRGTRTAAAVEERILKGDPDLAAVERARERAEARLAARTATPGEQAVVFAAGTGGVLLHEIVGHALEADTAARGGPLAAAGANVRLDPSVHIVDDPRRGRAAWRIDDEGESTRPIRLVSEGRVTGLLHDGRSAARSGCAPTGHGRRGSFREPVRPRMGCTFLVAGDADPKEVVADTARGVYVRRMESASYDPRSGTAWFRVTDADRLDRGQAHEPLEPFLLRVEAFEALNSLDGIARDLAFDTCVGTCLRDGQPIAVSVGAPTFRIGVATAVS